MDWLIELLMGDGVAHVIFVLALTIALGMLLAKVKIFGISLGATWILFVGIALSHFGMTLSSEISGFIKQFGLILFIFSIGMQVGPGFFASLRSGGLQKNLFTICIVLLGAVIAYSIHLITGTPMKTMIGVMSGSVISTPSLGAAEQTLYEVTGSNDSSLAQGYAVAYPFAVVSTIVMLSLIKKFSRNQQTINDDKAEDSKTNVSHLSILVENSKYNGLMLKELSRMVPFKFVVSRIRYIDGTIHPVEPTTIVHVGDRLNIIAEGVDSDALLRELGSLIPMNGKEWGLDNGKVMSRSVLVTRRSLHGKTLGDLKLRNSYNITVTRITRLGLDLLATPNFRLQMGDRLKIVGSESSVAAVAKFFGDSNEKLMAPNIIPIFVGIFLGVLLGCIPIVFPFIPQPIKLGLAGGPLIVAILLSRFGPNLRLITYTTKSANMMLREIGLSMFMAAVGLSAGSSFVSSIMGGGYIWALYAILINVIPFVLMTFIIMKVFRIDFSSVSGILSGSYTSPVTLAYANQLASNDVPSVNYATVYPMATFMRIIVAQSMVLFLI